MAAKLVFAFLALVAVATADTDAPTPGSVNCTKTEGGSNPALCPKNMRCIQSNIGYNGVNAQYACYPCSSNCDCAVGQYCSNTNSNSTTYGTCQSYAKKLNTPCTPDLTSSSGWKDLSTNVDSTLTSMTNGSQFFCGIYETVDKGNGQSNATVWKGTCIRGLCRECNSALMAGSVSDVSLNQYGNVDSIFSGVQDNIKLFCAADGGSSGQLFYDETSPEYYSNSYLGPARYCKNYAIVEAGSDLVGNMSGGVFKNQLAYSLVAFVVAAMALVA